ncbi:MAG TPA: site-specific integrase [Dehalococcoidia bacterium]|nr:site-specific integrase [Dehalococcoidia bacterium]
MPGKPKGLSCKEDALDPQQVTELLLVCSSLRDKFIIYSLIFAGLRVSELKHLQRAWFNAEEETITIPNRQTCECKECKKKRNCKWQPKTKKGARTILIHPKLLPVMHEFLAGHEEIGLTRTRIWQIVQKLGRDAGIPHVYPHALRSTAATIMAYKGVSGPTLQYDFGWARLSSAEEYVKSDMKRALNETREIYQKESV